MPPGCSPASDFQGKTGRRRRRIVAVNMSSTMTISVVPSNPLGKRDFSVRARYSTPLSAVKTGSSQCRRKSEQNSNIEPHTPEYSESFQIRSQSSRPNRPCFSLRTISSSMMRNTASVAHRFCRITVYLSCLSS
jgi:hypothetical protein